MKTLLMTSLLAAMLLSGCVSVRTYDANDRLTGRCKISGIGFGKKAQCIGFANQGKAEIVKDDVVVYPTRSR